MIEKRMMSYSVQLEKKVVSFKFSIKVISILSIKRLLSPSNLIWLNILRIFEDICYVGEDLNIKLRI